jgi:hypothetical protein
MIDPPPSPSPIVYIFYFQPAELANPVLTTPAIEPPCVIPHMPPRFTQILELLDTKTPRKGDWIAAKLHRAYSGSFRTTLADLVSLGKLTKVDGGGYLLATQLAE